MSHSYLTTEFLVTLLINLCNGFVQAGIFPASHWSTKTAGMLGAAISASVYAYSRGMVKSAATDPSGTATAEAGAPAKIAPTPTAPNLTAQRSSWMPPRTKIPLLILALLVPLFGAGCQQMQQAVQTPAELVTYREGLHAVDEPLYQAHELLMADAIKAGIRQAADQQVIAAGIAAAEGLYNQSKATQAASLIAPATQP
jgi:hypothetical protein